MAMDYVRSEIDTSHTPTFHPSEISVDKTEIITPRRLFLSKLFAAQVAVEQQVSVDPAIMHGAPCIAGTRIPAYLILEQFQF